MALYFKSPINLNFLNLSSCVRCRLVPKSMLLTTYIVIILFCTLSNFIFIMACTKHTSFKYLVDIGKRTDYFLHFLEEDRTIVKKERFRLLWWNLCQHLLAYLWEARRKMQKFFRRISSPIFQRAAVVSPYLFLALKKEHYQNINLCSPMFCLLFGKMIHILDKNGDLPLHNLSRMNNKSGFLQFRYMGFYKILLGDHFKHLLIFKMRASRYCF